MLAVVAVAICAGAPRGLTAYNALDPYEFEDSATESAEATDRIEAAPGSRPTCP